MQWQPIENYGVIGDLYTVALVGMNGSIDFMCFPHFDSPSVFARILDRERGGCFSLAPTTNDMKHKQMYLPDTNVLLTRFLSEGAIAEVSDFMPVEEVGVAHNLVRRAKCVHGEVTFRMVCDPRFDYGRCGHRVEKRGNDVYFFPENEDIPPLILRCGVPVEIHNGAAVAEFTLSAEEKVPFVLEDLDACKGSQCGSIDYVAEAFKDTVNFWHQWIRRCRYQGRWREMVRRSALTLKLLTSRKHGTMVASPTFGLPEEIGGVRNWDYRYCWIRDSAFTIYALIRLGYTEEAGKFMRWIERRCHELEGEEMPLHIMYGIDGRHDLPETHLDHFEGYRLSKPVRIGNGAYDQLQLDIYGELMDAVYLYDKYGERISVDLWSRLVRLIDWVCEHWQQPDEGIWEVRGGRKEFLYSRVLCWVAVDRGVRMALKRSLPMPMDRWMKARDAMYHDIIDNFWNEDLQSFVQFKGASTLDASALLMPLIKFISPTDPRFLKTLRAIERNLVEDSHVYRYKTEGESLDGLVGGEGTFCMCSFWYIECLSRAGDVDKASFLFDKMMGYANHLGLYAEELGTAGEHLGNFPQAFTHLSLISTAYNLDRKLNERGRG